jgi:hypothetical protein
MKHIKNFNESNKEEYYQEVGREEWDDFISVWGFNNIIPDSIIKKIDSLIDKSIYNIDITFPPISIVIKYRKTPDILLRDGRRIISKYSCSIYTSDDEWYWVSIPDIEPNRYKCDQDTGLIMLLKDKGII